MNSQAISNLVSNGTAQNVIAILVFIAVVGVLVYTKRIPQAKKIVLGVVLQAENTFGAKTGDIKYAYVTGLVYPKLPSIVRFFVTEKTLGEWIEEAVNQLKNQLQSNSTPVITEDGNKIASIDKADTTQ